MMRAAATTDGDHRHDVGWERGHFRETQTGSQTSAGIRDKAGKTNGAVTPLHSPEPSSENLLKCGREWHLASLGGERTSSSCSGGSYPCLVLRDESDNLVAGPYAQCYRST